MKTAILAVFLAAILALLARPLQDRLRELFRRAPGSLWAVPLLLAAIFAAASTVVDAFSVPLTLVVLVYAAVPVACVWLLPPSLDLVAVLFL